MANAKAAFVRAAFAKANMDAPREVREWFAGQPVKRDTVFQICFAFGLDGGETDEFFRRIYTKERSFNCHLVQEAIYYFCMNNGLTWADALDIQSQAPLAGKNAGDGEVVYTGSIIAELNDLETKEDFIDWLNENIDKFVPYITQWSFIRRMNGKATESRITTGTSIGWKATLCISISAIGRNSSMVMKTIGRLMKPWKHPGKRTIPTCRIG